MTDVRTWIAKAANSANPEVWANDLMQADIAAEKFERPQAGGCCGMRCVRVGTFELHYRFDELAGKEFYRHDLLKTIISVHEGSKDGAEALVRLLPTGCQTLSTEWIPFFRVVLSILDEKSWRDVADPRLTEIRAEAYETWWSMSNMTKDDALVTDAALNPEDFRDGAEVARQRAIELYTRLLEAHRRKEDFTQKIADLQAGRDTQMRKWVCYGD